MNKAELPESRLSRFASCGYHAYVYRDADNPEIVRIFSSCCKDRFCIPCGRLRARVICQNIKELIPSDGVRFITLTLSSSAYTLPEQLHRITKSFALLRRTRLWRSTTTGGAGFIEVKRSPSSPCWNVHLHVLAIGKYIPQKDLSDAWKAVTGDSYVVDIRLVRNLDASLHYVTKYVTKPIDASLMKDDSSLVAVIRSLATKRLLLPFGAWAKRKLTSIETTGVWVKVCPLGDFVTLVRVRDEWAMFWADQLYYPTHARPNDRSPPPQPDWIFALEREDVYAINTFNPERMDITEPSPAETPRQSYFPWVSEHRIHDSEPN